MMSALFFPVLALLSSLAPALAHGIGSGSGGGSVPVVTQGQPLSWETPGYSLRRPLYDGIEDGWHIVDPKSGVRSVGYGFSGSDGRGYDFKNRGFARLLDVDVDFYAEFSFKHYQIFEYTKSRQINYTASTLDVAAADKAHLADQVRAGLDAGARGPGGNGVDAHADAAASNELLAEDGKDVEANRQAGQVRDKLTLVVKKYDELRFSLKSKVEIAAIETEKKKLGQAVRYYGYGAGGHA
ncbi:hypothetical protein JCM11491_003664 [Sporobolomyces phaffii]